MFKNREMLKRYQNILEKKEYIITESVRNNLENKRNAIAREIYNQRELFEKLKTDNNLNVVTLVNMYKELKRLTESRDKDISFHEWNIERMDLPVVASIPSSSSSSSIASSSSLNPSSLEQVVPAKRGRGRPKGSTNKRQRGEIVST